MKAIQYTAFGNSSVLQLNEVSKPTIREDEVLIKVAAITVNPFDIKVRSGAMQKVMPVALPYTSGSDVSGVIEAVGNKVTRLKTGDVVFGTTFGGAYAQYIAIKEGQVTVKPVNVSIQEAAALAVPIVTSCTFLEAAELKTGQRVLILGASGSVGSVLLQMAKALGAYVIGTASGAGIEKLKLEGADEVINYKTEAFFQLVKNIDVVADLVGGEMQTHSFQTLRKGGKLISTVMPPSDQLAKQFEVNVQFINSSPSFQKLEFGKKLVEENKVKPSVSKIMNWEQAAAAQDLLSAGGINGKIVLEVK